MSAFEIWQVVVMLIQSGILFLTFLGALYIGFKQTEINNNLLDLNFSPSVEVVYDQASKRLNITNKGKTNMLLWGTGFNNNMKAVDKESRLITPGGFYYILAPTLEEQVGTIMGQSAEARVLLEVFIESENRRKYIVRAMLLAIRTQNVLNFHTQTLGIVRSDW